MIPFIYIGRIPNVFIFILTVILYFFTDAPVSGENRFFYSEYENLLKRMEGPDSLSTKKYMDTVRQQKIEQDWSYPELPHDYHTHQLVELNYIPMEQGMLRSAYSYYENAIVIMNAMREELTAMDNQIKSVKSNIWWKKIDEIDSLKRKRNKIKMKYAVSLSETAGKTIHILEGIQNSKVRSDRSYINLYFHSLRMFIIYEVMMNNYDLAFPALQRYRFYPNSEFEWPYHYLLSRCYMNQYLLAKKKSEVGEEYLLLLRNMKNMHHLIAILLKYGISSEEYKQSKVKVYAEELSSPRK
jgi:uncharacterized protein YlxP (DUF503 family)